MIVLILLLAFFIRKIIKMKFTKIFIGLFLSLVFVSCSNDDTFTEGEQKLKSYELLSIQWKLNETDGQSIVEEKIPEFNFRNDSDTTMVVTIEPIKDMEGSSIFKFNDSIAFKELNFSEVQVSIPKELSLLSKEYVYLVGGVNVPFVQEESSFPFSFNFIESYTLSPRSTFTSNYTVFIRKNKASFLATFMESTTGEILRLDGTWTGLFFNNLDSKAVIGDID